MNSRQQVDSNTTKPGPVPSCAEVLLEEPLVAEAEKENGLGNRWTELFAGRRFGTAICTGRS